MEATTGKFQLGLRDAAHRYGLAGFWRWWTGALAELIPTAPRTALRPYRQVTEQVVGNMFGRPGFQVVAPGAPVPVPHFLLRPALKRLFRAGVISFPAGELDHLQYLCVVDGSRAAREMGWTPRYTLRETIRSVLT